MYRLIGNKSPILEITAAQAEALEKALNTMEEGGGTSDEKSSIVHHPSSFKVYVGMRYWHPFIKDTVKKILNDGVTKIIAISLYPHYSKATTGSSIAELKHVLRGLDIDVSFIEHWYDFPQYIEALTEKVHSGISEFNGNNFEIIFSAHNLPEDFIQAGDPYVDHIKSTITAVNSLLAVRYSLDVKWHLSFQSKSGPVQWLQPLTSETIIRLAEIGIKNVLLVPISFVSDHIETLYEIDILFKELAMKHGVKLVRCESLNTSEKFINALKGLVLKGTADAYDGRME